MARPGRRSARRSRRAGARSSPRRCRARRSRWLVASACGTRLGERALLLRREQHLLAEVGHLAVACSRSLNAMRSASDSHRRRRAQAGEVCVEVGLELVEQDSNSRRPTCRRRDVGRIDDHRARRLQRGDAPPRRRGRSRRCSRSSRLRATPIARPSARRRRATACSRARPCPACCASRGSSDPRRPSRRAASRHRRPCAPSGRRCPGCARSG